MSGRKQLRQTDMMQLAAAKAEGKSNRRIAKEMGLSPTTITNYLAKPEVQALQEQAVEVLKSQFTDIAKRANARISDDKLDKCSAQQLVTISGIAADKLDMLSGNKAGAPVVQILIGDPTGSGAAPTVIEVNDPTATPRTIDATATEGATK